MNTLREILLDVLYKTPCGEEFDNKIVDQALKEIKEYYLNSLPKENWDKHDLAEKIGSLFMGKTKESMQKGFKEYKKLAEIKKERNIGYNACLSEIKEKNKSMGDYKSHQN